MMSGTVRGKGRKCILVSGDAGVGAVTVAGIYNTADAFVAKTDQFFHSFRRHSLIVQQKGTAHIGNRRRNRNHGNMGIIQGCGFLNEPGIGQTQKDSTCFSGIQKFHVLADAVGSGSVNGTDDQGISCLGNIFLNIKYIFRNSRILFCKKGDGLSVKSLERCLYICIRSVLILLDHA